VTTATVVGERDAILSTVHMLRIGKLNENRTFKIWSSLSRSCWLASLPSTLKMGEAEITAGAQPHAECESQHALLERLTAA
jgi:hypothetical protein